jgi:hypothetical protein
MVFIVTGHAESGPVSYACDTAAGALERARWFAERGIRDLLIDADGQEYAPADFQRLFVEPGLAEASRARLGPDSEDQQEEPDWAA